MFKFFFKKNFFDVWDNLFHVIACNLISLIVLALSAFLCFAAVSVPEGDLARNVCTFAAVAVSCILISIFSFAEGSNAADVASFDTPRFLDYFKSVVPSIKDGVLFGLLSALLAGIAFVSIPYYFNMYRAGGTAGFVYLLLAALIFWFIVITILALQWFLPVRSLMGNSFVKCLKKSYIIFFDNPAFTLGVALVNVLNIVLSVVTLGLVPGMSGIIITNTNALRLRLYKYDWLEVNPDLTPQERKNVPWGDLLAKDRRIVGDRKLRSLFMPWKQ